MPFVKHPTLSDFYEFICTAEDPWNNSKVAPNNKHYRKVHPDSRVVYDGGDYESSRCPHCDQYFTEEIAQ